MADESTVTGRLTGGRDTLRTANPDITFLIERRPDGYFQTARHASLAQARTERMDVVVGSGRRGQTYLFWQNGVLVELPVSWLADPPGWINSPGYLDGQVDFSRVVVPRCLECHATSFRVEVTAGSARYAPDYTLGITCVKCHGDGTAHIEGRRRSPADTAAHDIVNPSRLSRDQQLDECALCHGGGLRLRRPPFSFRPGQPLDSFFVVNHDSAAASPDVHGDQVGLLRLSRCFRESPNLTCTTCHDVHRTERDPASLSGKCLACHEAGRHPALAAGQGALAGRCVDCHMPTGVSQALQVNTATGGTPLRFRTHRIGIYPAPSGPR